MRVNPKRSVLVMGCGAMGGILAQGMSHCAEIVVIDPSPRVKLKTPALPDAGPIKGQRFDGLIVATKCYDIEQALRSLKNQIFFSRVLFIQNGVINLTELARLVKDASIVRGVTTSAIGVSSGRAFFHFQGQFYLGTENSHEGEAPGWFNRLLSDAGLKTTLMQNPSRFVWAKLIFSAVMNPLPVITGRSYDILRADKDIWQLVKQGAMEGRSVAQALGIRLAFDPLKLIYRVREGDLAGIPHRGTMYDDMGLNRTELDFITGAIIRQARKVGLKTPALDLIFQRAKSAGA